MSNKMTSIKELNTKWYGLREASGTDRHQVFIDEKGNVLRMGPFVQGNKINSNAIALVEERYNKLSAAQVKYIAEYVKSDRMWMLFKDFTAGYNIDSTSSPADSQGTYIANMDEMDKYINVCQKQKWVQESVDLLETLVWLWVLGVSMQMNNVYVDTKKKTFWIIDLYKSISADHLKAGHREDEPLFFLAVNPNSKCKFFQHMGQYYEEIIDRLAKKGNDDSIMEPFTNEDIARINRAVELLNKYYKVWEVQYGGKAGEEGYEDILPRKQAEYNILGEGPMVGKPVGPEKKGQMSATKSNAVTYSGFPFKTALNWLAQYIRESDNEKAVMLAVELYHVKNAGGNYADTHYKSFIKQLKITAARDIGTANYPLALAIIDFLNRYYDNVTYVEIISIVIAMCDSEKTRLAHDLYKIANIAAKRDNAKCMEKIKEANMVTSDDLAISMDKKSSEDPIYKSLLELGINPDETATSGYQLSKAIKEKKIEDSMVLLRDQLEEWCNENGRLGDVPNKALVSYIDKDLKEHKTTRCDIVIWYILDKATVKEVNDDFWISNNILRYAYYMDVTPSKDFLILAVAAAASGMAYEQHALRFEEAGAMDYYLPADRKVTNKFGVFSKDEDYIAKDVTDKSWNVVKEVLAACKSKPKKK